MGTKMGIRELRDGLPAAVRRARAGETIEITHHGAPVALLTPVPEDRLDALIARGEVTAPVAPLELAPRHPATGAKTASRVLEDDRAER